MFNWIFKFLFIVFACFALLDLAYQHPGMVLDIGVIGIGVFLYYFFVVSRIFAIKLFYAAVIAGLLLSGFNLLPINTQLSVQKELEAGSVFSSIKEIANKGYLPPPRVKNFSEFVTLAKIYYVNFLLKNFFIVFLAAMLFAELSYLRQIVRFEMSKEKYV